MKTVDILGTKYEVQFLDEPDEELNSDGINGNCNFYEKRIKVVKDEMEDEVLAHEIVHAYLHESGIAFGTYFHSEECVNWIALQIEKIMESIEEAKEGEE